jgi:hypothetical protein
MQTNQEMLLSIQKSRANFWIQRLNKQGQELFSAAYPQASIVTDSSITYQLNEQISFGLTRLYYGELEDLANLMTSYSWTQVIAQPLDANQILILRSQAGNLPPHLEDFIERLMGETPHFCRYLPGYTLKITADPSAAQSIPLWIFYHQHLASAPLLDFLAGGFTLAQVLDELAAAKARLEQRLQNPLDTLEFLLGQPKYITFTF